MNDLPLPNIFANFIYCCHAFEHTERPSDALREFKRVLKPGGILFMSTPYPTYTMHFVMDKQHINVLSEWQIAKLLHHTGIHPLKVYVVKFDEKNENTWSIITVGRVI